MRSRRLLCLLTALLFALSSAGHVYAVTGTVVKMPAAAMDGATPDHGMDCGGDDNAAKTNCMAMCATSFAILADAAPIPSVIALRTIESASELLLPEREPLPEPHPPRT